MKPFPQPEPLTDAELDRLGDFLRSCKGGKAMNLEELDGFFSALIAGPEPVMPSEYNREVFGGEMSEAVEFSNVDEAQGNSESDDAALEQDCLNALQGRNPCSAHL